MTRFLLAVVAGVVAIVLCDLMRWRLNDMWAPPVRSWR